MLVLGIDAAWTMNNPSGIALVECKGQTINLLALAASYPAFIGDPVQGPAPHLAQLCRIAGQNNPSQVQVIAADIPLAYTPITGRRKSDNAVSKAYGAKWAAVHSPTAARPGALSTEFVLQAQVLGFSLTTEGNQVPGPKLLEVYPHAAIIEMMQLSYRLPYKVTNRSKYNPSLSPAERWDAVLANMDQLYNELCNRIGGVADFLGRPSVLAANHNTRIAKGIEDMLDAIVCAWVGCCFLNKQITAYGDANSTIWVPRL